MGGSLCAKLSDGKSCTVAFGEIEIVPMGSDMLVLRFSTAKNESSDAFRDFLENDNVVAFDCYFEENFVFSHSIEGKEDSHTIIGVNREPDENGVIIYEIQTGLMGFYQEDSSSIPSLLHSEWRSA